MSRKSILTLSAIAVLGFLAPGDAFAHGGGGFAGSGHFGMGASHARFLSPAGSAVLSHPRFLSPAGSAVLKSAGGQGGHLTSVSFGDGNRHNGRPMFPFHHHDHFPFGQGGGFGGGGMDPGAGGGFGGGNGGGSYQPTGTSYGGSAAAPQAPCNCLTKQYLQDGSVLFQDTCTREAAIMPAAQQANGAAPTR